MINLKLPHFVILGDVLEGSGWTHIISSSTVVPSGKANAVLSVPSNIVLCCYMHQITACALYGKKNKKESIPKVSPFEYRAPCFTNVIVGKKTILFEFVKSICSGNLQLYVNTLMKNGCLHWITITMVGSYPST